ncbi:MAG: tRNA (adenosine(37)-N6)-threonylcarbamoyltransferase complex ATPase subunit type 1 TsaE [Proteobacteria bacterium]|nr:tRNA (adenosine(37)-N6)-threonylcarbamoyltransferase complex ATPase subunit type 1 TsaE [Pseudomonadota bacterium]
MEWRIALADEAETMRIAARLAAELQPGDLVTLSGDLGAGKTTFARAAIRALAEDEALEVPSPTYSLIQTYDSPRGRIVHADLYRVNDIGELAELGWDDEADGAIVFCEWAERAGSILAEDRLDARLEIAPEGAGRVLALTGHGRLAPRLRRARAIAALFTKAGFADPQRAYMQGDASGRAYERVTDGGTGRRAILMISPRRPDGPPIRMGKSYSTLVHLAESVHAFVAMTRGLRDQGFSAPEIYAADLDSGLLLIEDFGSEPVVDPQGPIPERYSVAVDVLAELHGRALPAELPVSGVETHKIHRYDLEALTIEAELLLDWFFPYATQRTANAGQRLSFVDAWVSTLESVIAGERTWTLRDYHSPNLIWLPERAGLNRIGLIDYQDCVIGHPAYDVVSLAQDARVEVPEALELQLLARYALGRKRRDPDFDMAGFTTAYAILGAQRATKILGIFVRLDRRDGKPVYLKHLPRIEAYLKRCLRHPALSRLAAWYGANLPGFVPETSGPNGDGNENAAGENHAGHGAGGGPRHADAPADE